MIKIDGLSIQQVKFLERIWNMESMEQVEQFINSFSPQQQCEYWTLVELAKAATFDTIEDIDEAVIQIINNIKNLDSQ